MEDFMKTRDYDYLEDDTRSYYIKFEELIGNVFSILNCTDDFIDDMSFAVFDKYLEYTKAKFIENNIRIVSFVSFFDWEEINEHGIFEPYTNDPESNHYDSIKMLRPLSQEEFTEKFKQHPEEYLAILTDETISNQIIKYHNGSGKKYIFKK